MGEILGSKVPSRYIQHRVNSRRGIAGLSCSMKLAKCQRMAMSRDSVRWVNIIREGYSNKAVYYFEE